MGVFFGCKYFAFHHTKRIAGSFPQCSPQQAFFRAARRGMRIGWYRTRMVYASM